MSRSSFVELESGEQEYFDNPYLAFKWAKGQEDKQRNSVSYVAISGVCEGDSDFEVLLAASDITIYRGQRLRHMIRSLDDVIGWVRTQLEEQNADNQEGNS